jgi:hypothetical protein
MHVWKSTTGSEWSKAWTLRRTEMTKRPAEVFTGTAGALLVLSEAFWTDFDEKQLAALAGVIAMIPFVVSALVETWRSFREDRRAAQDGSA